jgi:hypothetical protein
MPIIQARARGRARVQRASVLCLVGRLREDPHYGQPKEAACHSD